MTRQESLERVLVAAKAVLEAREDQMLTRVEWDELTAACASAGSDEPVICNQPVRIVFEDGLMTVMDGINLGYDCMDLCDCSFESAMEQIDRWARQYAFDIEVAKHELNEYLETM